MCSELERKAEKRIWPVFRHLTGFRGLLSILWGEYFDQKKRT